MGIDYRHEPYGAIRVAWTDDLDGGGRSFGQQAVRAAAALIGPVERACEVCAGPGFIGFSLLASGLCRTLCLTDVNPAAVDAIRRTIDENGLHDRVSVHLADGLDGVPAHERWDLVVSNPPHFDGAQAGEWGLRAFDPRWRIHRRLYAGMRPHLTPHGQCFFLENYHGSSEETFVPLLDGTGLEYAGSFMVNADTPRDMASHELPPLNTFYVFWTRAAHAEIVWRTAAPRDVTLTLDPSGGVTHDRTAPGTPEAPLRLAVGEKYTVSMASRRDGWKLHWDVMDNVLRARPSGGANAGEDTRHGWPPSVACIATAPGRIADATGRVVVEFE